MIVVYVCAVCMLRNRHYYNVATFYYYFLRYVRQTRCLTEIDADVYIISVFWRVSACEASKTHENNKKKREMKTVFSMVRQFMLPCLVCVVVCVISQRLFLLRSQLKMCAIVKWTQHQNECEVSSCIFFFFEEKDINERESIQEPAHMCAFCVLKQAYRSRFMLCSFSWNTRIRFVFVCAFSSPDRTQISLHERFFLFHLISFVWSIFVRIFFDGFSFDALHATFLHLLYDVLISFALQREEKEIISVFLFIELCLTCAMIWWLPAVLRHVRFPPSAIFNMHNSPIAVPTIFYAKKKIIRFSVVTSIKSTNRF